MKGFTGRVIFVTALFLSSLNVAVAEGDVYRVVGIPQGQTLSIHNQPNESGGVVVKVPHNASWFVLRGQPQNGWQRIAWNNQNGWVKSEHLEFDKAATNVKAERDFCLKDPTVSNKICCGFPPGAQSEIFKSVKVYSTSGIAKGDTLKLYSSPSKTSSIVIAAPHNATWIVKLNQSSKKQGVNWEKVRWNGTTGWVEDSKISFDPEMTNVGDMKREMCSVPAGCAPDFSGATEKK